jgi:hypothetical protein
LFDKLTDQVSQISLKLIEDDDAKFNHCADCNIRMELTGTNYKCSQCGYTMCNDPDRGKDLDEAGSSSIRITTGANKGRLRNGNADYSKVQKKNLLDQLMQKQTQYDGPKFSKDILLAAVVQYGMSQKYIKQEEKKFVRRGSIRDEILASLVFFECIRAKNIRKRKDIATFMGLLTSGFARGEDIVRTWQAQGLIDLPVNEETVEGYADRYLEALGLENPIYNAFISEIVKASMDNKIAMSSQISSKIVGSIWILITQLGLNISAKTLEDAADNTKKNTFMKFCKAVYSAGHIFAIIFRKCDIPFPTI